MKVINKILILFLIIVPAKVFSNKTSSESDFDESKCKCNRSEDVITLDCGKDLMEIQYVKSGYFYIFCNNKDALNILTIPEEICANSLFDNIPNVTSVLKVFIKKCYLPNGKSIKSYLNIFGVADTKSLYIEGGQSYLNREHLLGLEDFEMFEVLNIQNELFELPGDLFQNVRNLTSLKFQGNVTFPKDIFSNLERLKSLQMNGNKNLHNLEKGIFKNQRKLKTIDFSYNNFLNLRKDDLEGLSSLEKLDLRWNKIKEISSDCFSSLTNLKYLDLSENNLVNYLIPQQLFKNNRKLEILNLDNVFAENEYNVLPEKLFDNQKNLRELHLSKNELIHCPNLDSILELQILDLSYNRLTR